MKLVNSTASLKHASENIAYDMLYLATDEAAYVTGQATSIDDGSLLPESPVQIREYYAAFNQ